MKFLRPLNQIVLPIIRNKKAYYFFLDTGFPTSFSNTPNVSSISSLDFGITEKFDIRIIPESFNPFRKEAPNMSKCLGIELSGFLGADFIKHFDNVVINYKTREINFNVPNPKGDIVIPFNDNIEPRYSRFFTGMSLGENGGKTMALIDMGCTFCCTSLKFRGHFQKSKGWKSLGLYVTFTSDYFADVPVLLDSNMMGNYTIATPTPPGTPEMILGGNLLSQYICIFDNTKKVLKLTPNPREVWLESDRPSYVHGIGFDTIVDPSIKKISINSIFEESPNRKYFNEGDEVSFEELDWDDMEIVNQISNKIFSSNRTEVSLKINGVERTLKTYPLFE